MLNWDKVKSERELLIREMLYGNVKDILKKYSKEKLKETFLKNLHRFDAKNKAFWKLALDISDEEIEQRTKKSFREGGRSWNF
jgi:predicted nucleic acid-binding protein